MERKSEVEIRAEDEEVVKPGRTNHYVWIKSVGIVVPKGKALWHGLGIQFLALALYLASIYLLCDKLYLSQYVPSLCMLVSFLAGWVTFKDPGFKQGGEISSTGLQVLMDSGAMSCKHCLTLHSDKVTHCPFCQCCVYRRDHHCDVFGNCIGIKNIVCFYAGAILGGIGMLYLYYLLMNVSVCIHS